MGRRSREIKRLEAVEVSQDPEKVKVALGMCQKDVTKVQVEQNHLLAKHGDVVLCTDWETPDCLLGELSEEDGFLNKHQLVWLTMLIARKLTL
ncbi:translin-associated factor X-interacting protein 1 [Arapaima gigas]